METMGRKTQRTYRSQGVTFLFGLIRLMPADARTRLRIAERHPCGCGSNFHRARVELGRWSNGVAFAASAGPIICWGVES